MKQEQPLMAGEPAATADAGPRAGELRAKAERLAELCADLRISRDHVATEGGLMRAKLGGALADALFRNAALLDEAGELAMTGYRAAAGGSKRPRRRNRVQRRIDQGLDRLRSAGRALIIDRSGLWQGGEGRLARAALDGRLRPAGRRSRDPAQGALRSRLVPGAASRHCGRPGKSAGALSVAGRQRGRRSASAVPHALLCRSERRGSGGQRAYGA
jgi:hypothetical protein